MKQITIVGKSDGYEEVNHADGTIWVVSSVFKLLQQPEKVDLIFQLHKADVWEDWLPEESLRVVTAFPAPFPSRLFPAKRMIEQYGPVFGSTIAWMIAYAMEQLPEQINILGVDMATRDEYIYQRDTFFYFCGRAEQLGIKINIPTNRRTFFKDQIYGVM